MPLSVSLWFIYLFSFFFFFFNDTATTEIYTLSLHDALPIPVLSSPRWSQARVSRPDQDPPALLAAQHLVVGRRPDRVQVHGVERQVAALAAALPQRGRAHPAAVLHPELVVQPEQLGGDGADDLDPAVARFGRLLVQLRHGRVPGGGDVRLSVSSSLRSAVASSSVTCVVSRRSITSSTISSRSDCLRCSDWISDCRFSSSRGELTMPPSSRLRSRSILARTCSTSASALACSRFRSLLRAVSAAIVSRSSPSRASSLTSSACSGSPRRRCSARPSSASISASSSSRSCASGDA